VEQGFLPSTCARCGHVPNRCASHAGAQASGDAAVLGRNCTVTLLHQPSASSPVKAGLDCNQERLGRETLHTQFGFP
jgi:hypothetical protein